MKCKEASRHWATAMLEVSVALVVPQRIDAGPGGGAASTVLVAVPAAVTDGGA
jgi:hypothetical protein